MDGFTNDAQQIVKPCAYEQWLNESTLILPVIPFGRQQPLPQEYLEASTHGSFSVVGMIVDEDVSNRTFTIQQVHEFRKVEGNDLAT